MTFASEEKLEIAGFVLLQQWKMQQELYLLALDCRNEIFIFLKVTHSSEL